MGQETQAPSGGVTYTSGIVVTLCPDDDARRELFGWLASLPGVEIGAIEAGLRVSIAAQTDSLATRRSFWEALETHAAVRFLSLVYSHEDAGEVAG